MSEERKQFEGEMIKTKTTSCEYLMTIKCVSGPAFGNSAKLLHWLHHKDSGAELGLSRMRQSLGGLNGPLEMPLSLYCHYMGCLH